MNAERTVPGRLRRAALGGVLALCCAAAAAASTMGDIIALSSISADNRHPNVAAAVDSGRAFAVWDGLRDNARRIFMRESVNGVWMTEAVIVDSEPAMENSSPVVVSDPSGNPHVAWVARSGARSLIFYWFRIGAESAEPRLVWSSAPEYGETCDGLDLQLDQQGRPWLAWHAGAGNHYSILCAHVDAASGDFIVQNLTPYADNYNLYPQVFSTPNIGVLWYSARDADFAVVGERLNENGAAWLPLTMDDMAAMPANRLPLILQMPTGAWAGLWYDVLNAADRVFLGIQSRETSGAGFVVDHQPDATNRLPCGVLSGNELLIVWCSENAERGSQVFFTRGNPPAWEADEMVSDGRKDYCVSPKIAAVPGGAVVVWASSGDEGGVGQVFARHIAF